MKDQYVGDIGDFGKYSLLRAFADAGVKVGVNWYLTENDGSTDGKFTEYLKKNDRIMDIILRICKNRSYNIRRRAGNTPEYKKRSCGKKEMGN